MANEHKIIRENIRYLRQSHGISRTAMAKALHISLQSLDLLEAGIFPERINIQFLFYAGKAFSLSPRHLCNPLQKDSPHDSR